MDQTHPNENILIPDIICVTDVTTQLAIRLVDNFCPPFYPYYFKLLQSGKIQILIRTEEPGIPAPSLIAIEIAVSREPERDSSISDQKWSPDLSGTFDNSKYNNFEW